jgi:hypothetical protein
MALTGIVVVVKVLVTRSEHTFQRYKAKFLDPGKV